MSGGSGFASTLDISPSCQPCRCRCQRLAASGPPHPSVAAAVTRARAPVGICTTDRSRCNSRGWRQEAAATACRWTAQPRARARCFFSHRAQVDASPAGGGVRFEGPHITFWPRILLVPAIVFLPFPFFRLIPPPPNCILFLRLASSAFEASKALFDAWSSSQLLARVPPLSNSIPLCCGATSPIIAAHRPPVLKSRAEALLAPRAPRAAPVGTLPPRSFSSAHSVPGTGSWKHR
jgi:hypothetical protein